MRPFVLAALVVTVTATAAACVAPLEATGLQPHPARVPREAGDLPRGEALSIYTREMTLPRWMQLRHDASFVVVSRDRVRVHLSVCEAWEELADPRAWTVWLEDERGQRLVPAEREVARLDRVALEWEREPGWRPGDSMKQKNRRLIPSIDFWRGRADYVFFGPELMGAGRRGVTVVAHRAGRTLRFAWTFGDGWQVAHHGRSRADDALGIIAVPGPETRIAATRWLD